MSINAEFLERYLLRILCSVFNAYSAVFFVPEKLNGEEFCRLFAAYSTENKIKADTVIPLGKGLVGWIVKHSKALRVPTFDQNQSKLGYYEGGEEANIKSFMGCPTMKGGALCVDSKRQHSFSAEDHNLLQIFAEMLSQLQLARDDENLTGTISAYFTQMGKVHALRTHYQGWSEYRQKYLQAILDATQFDYVAFASIYEAETSYIIEGNVGKWLIDKPGAVVRTLGNGIAGWVFRNEQPVIEENSNATLFGNLSDLPIFRTVLCLPIIVNKNTQAVLCLAHNETRHIDADLRNFLKQAIDNISLFLENFYLQTRIRSLLPKVQLHNEKRERYNRETDRETD